MRLTNSPAMSSQRWAVISSSGAAERLQWKTGLVTSSFKARQSPNSLARARGFSPRMVPPSSSGCLEGLRS